MHMVTEFCEVSGQCEESMIAFITRLSPTAFRASCGVEVYLDTHSVEAMAKALGHTTYSSALLSSYLPEPILDFFLNTLDPDIPARPDLRSDEGQPLHPGSHAL